MHADEAFLNSFLRRKDLRQSAAILTYPLEKFHLEEGQEFANEEAIGNFRHGRPGPFERDLLG
jgi:hypothetical protein